MNLDELIRTSVHDVAERSPVSSPDVSALRRRVRRTRLLQVLTTAAVIAGVVAISAVVAGDTGDRRSTAPADTATAQATATTTETPPSIGEGGPAVWRLGDVIHVGARTVSGRKDVAFGPSLLRTEVVYVDGHGTVFVQAPEGEPREIGQGAKRGAVGDPRGSVVAWFDQSGPLPELVVYDTDTDKELRREDLGPDDLGDPRYLVASWSPIVAVTDGAVCYRGGDDALMGFRWAEDDYPTVHADERTTLDVANGVMARMNDGVYFTRSGADAVRADEPLKPTGSLNSDGRLFLGYDDNGAVVVDTETGQVSPLGGSSRQRASEGSWSYGSTVMLTAYNLPPRGRIVIDSAPGDLLSCDGGSGRCRVVASFEGVPQGLPAPVGPIT